jgi:hypothetical protein
MIDLEKLSKEHEQLFPNATAESQLWKLEEEIREFDDAYGYEDEIKEAADVEIVCAGLYRWFPLFVWHFLDGFECMDYNWSLVHAEVNRKWEVNKKRKWVWNGKTYHHEGNDDI